MNEINLKSVTNEILVRDAKNLCAEERRLTTLVLEYLREIESRKIHLAMGYSSLYEFCKTELHYSEGSAHRRISAMRLMAEVPEIKPMIESGAVSLSGIASIQSFCNNQKKQEKPVAIEDKKKLVEDIQHKTTRQVESLLLTLDPESVKKDRERLVTPELTEVKMTFDQNTMKLIEDLKAWMSHSMPFASTKDILLMALKELAERKNPTRTVRQKQQRDPLKPKSDLHSDLQSVPGKNEFCENARENQGTPAMKNTTGQNTNCTLRNRQRTKKQDCSFTRYISPKIRKLVWKQHQGKCCYKNPETGKACGSQRFVQIDHKFPFSRGGGHDVLNLQLLCGAHNRMKGVSVALSK